MPRTKVAFILLVVLYVGFVYATDKSGLVPAPRRQVIGLTPAPGRFSEPSIAVNSANPQQVVTAFQSNASGGYSTDGGETWNLAEGTAPSGAIHVMFYDRRRDPENRQVEVVLARSTDEGKTFQNYLLSEHPYDPHGSSIGTTALAAYAGRVYGSWTEVVPDASGSGGLSDLDGRQAIIGIGTADFRSGTESAKTRN